MEPATLTKRIETVAFSTVQFQGGYSCDDVDAFLDTLVARINSSATTEELHALIDGARFGPTTMQRGYSVDEVDAFLADLLPEGAALVQRPVPPVDAVSSTVGAPDPNRDRSTGTSAIIAPKKGFFARLFGRS